MADEDDEEYEDYDDELDVGGDWEQLAVSENLDLDESWINYLAQADPPSNVEGVDLSIPDFEEESGSQEEHYV